ncbi:MAG: hypothetical protein JWR32_6311 [Mycobacterium sp.]|nr:hypothetical protein [Mycobacterium sp.]
MTSQVWLVTGAARGLGMAIAQAALEAVLDEIAAWRGLSGTIGYDPAC